MPPNERARFRKPLHLERFTLQHKRSLLRRKPDPVHFKAEDSPVLFDQALSAAVPLHEKEMRIQILREFDAPEDASEDFTFSFHDTGYAGNGIFHAKAAQIARLISDHDPGIGMGQPELAHGFEIGGQSVGDGVLAGGAEPFRARKRKPFHNAIRIGHPRFIKIGTDA